MIPFEKQTITTPQGLQVECVPGLVQMQVQPQLQKTFSFVDGSTHDFTFGVVPMMEYPVNEVQIPYHLEEASKWFFAYTNKNIEHRMKMANMPVPEKTLWECIKDTLMADGRFFEEKWSGNKHENYVTLLSKGGKRAYHKLKKRVGYMTEAAINIRAVRIDPKDGVEIKIEFWTKSMGHDFQRYFQGFVTTEQEFDMLLVMMGIK